MDIIYSTHLASSLTTFADKAAAVWNDTLQGIVSLKSNDGTMPSHVLVVWCYGVRNDANPTRIAECQRTGPDRWQIRLEASLRWRRDTFWDRVLGRGEDTFATLVHEFGHVFGPLLLTHQTPP